MGNNTLMGLLKDRQIAQSPISRKLLAHIHLKRVSKSSKGSSGGSFFYKLQ